MTASTKIESGRELFTLINTFHVKPENQSALVDSLKRVTEGVTQRLPGFVAAAVHASFDGQVVINYVQWRSRAAFDAMLVLPAMQDHLREVGALASSVVPVFCDVAYVGAADDA